MTDFSAIVSKCKNSNIGKLLPGALYIHTSALDAMLTRLAKMFKKSSGYN